MAGPPVKVQVKVLDSLLNVSLVTLGVPTCQRTQEQYLQEFRVRKLAPSAPRKNEIAILCNITR